MSVISTTTELKFNQQDVITVAVARAEELMNSELKKAQGEIVEIEKSIKADEKEIETSLKDAANAEMLAKVTAVAKSVADAGLGKVNASVSYSIDNNDSTILLITGKVTTPKDSYYGLSFAASTKVPEKVAGLRTKIGESHAKLTETRETAVGWRKRLGSIGSLERKYRAQLVEKQLGATEEGKELLASIGVSFEKDILQLA